MTRFRHGLMGLLLAMPLVPAYGAPARTASATTSTAALQAEITRLTKGSGGTMGVAAWRLDGQGPKLLVNADQTFPMASTFKVAVAGRIMSRIEKGELRLDQMIEVKPEMLVPSPVIADRLIHPGISLSVYNLLELMLTQSDNTATDVLTAAAGGPGAVTAWVREQGVTNMRIDRATAGLLRDFYGVPDGPPMEVFAAADKDPAMAAKGDRPNPAFDHDPRDQTTPDAMAVLLTRIFTGKAMSAESMKVIIPIMERCRTGVTRLRAMLPDGTVVADKTGTIGGTVNDVGVITLPDGAGQIVIATYIKESVLPEAAREHVIAQVARAVYDYYLFAPPGK
jgi:beta-lactamase class A